MPFAVNIGVGAAGSVVVYFFIYVIIFDLIYQNQINLANCLWIKTWFFLIYKFINNKLINKLKCNYSFYDMFLLIDNQ